MNEQREYTFEWVLQCIWLTTWIAWALILKLLGYQGNLRLILGVLGELRLRFGGGGHLGFKGDQSFRGRHLFILQREVVTLFNKSLLTLSDWNIKSYIDCLFKDCMCRIILVSCHHFIYRFNSFMSGQLKLEYLAHLLWVVYAIVIVYIDWWYLWCYLFEFVDTFCGKLSCSIFRNLKFLFISMN